MPVGHSANSRDFAHTQWPGEVRLDHLQRLLNGLHVMHDEAGILANQPPARLIICAILACSTGVLSSAGSACRTEWPLMIPWTKTNERSAKLLSAGWQQPGRATLQP